MKPEFVSKKHEYHPDNPESFNEKPFQTLLSLFIFQAIREMGNTKTNTKLLGQEKKSRVSSSTFSTNAIICWTKNSFLDSLSSHFKTDFKFLR